MLLIIYGDGERTDVTLSNDFSNIFERNLKKC